MSDHPFITDLKFAHTAGVRVDIRLRSGKRYVGAAVVDVDDAHHMTMLNVGHKLGGRSG